MRSPIPRTLARTLALALLTAALAQSAEVVIAEVYGGGGNSGATLTNDYVVLYNTTAVPVVVTGRSVQYASATGSTWQSTALTGTIQPFGFYLVQQAQGAGGTTPLPAPDATGTIAMAATAGKVALVATTVALSGANPLPNATISDLVGYGTTASAFEGAGRAPAPSNTRAIARDLGRQQPDTDNNAVDFATVDPAPRNTSSPPSPPPPPPASTAPTGSGLASPGSVLPGTGTRLTVLVSPGANPPSSGITVTVDLAPFGQGVQTLGDAGIDGDVLAGDGIFSLAITVPAVQPAGALALSATISDAQARSSTAAIALTVIDTTPGALRIHDLQGAAHRSPREGQQVSNVPGIVTATRGNGFYLQDPIPDGDPATSEAIFVFTGSAPPVQIAQSVLVSGRVTEFRPGGSTSSNLTTTEISSPLVIVLAVGQALPAPVVIGVGGRVPPTALIDDDATGDVETSGSFDVATDGIDFWESLEAMRVQVDDAVVVGPTSDFGELVVLAQNGAGAGPRSARGGVLLQEADFNPERIIIDDAILAGTPQANVGDHLPGAIIGVIDYSFGNFKLAFTQPLPPVLADGATRETTSLVAGGTQVTVATYNVENLDPSDQTFAAHAAVIVGNLGAPDILCLEEVQDDNGAVNASDPVVTAGVTLQRLIDAISAAGGPSYAFRVIDPVDDQDGGQPGGNIRQAFLFRRDHVAFVDLPGGDAITPIAVLAGGQLSISPGRILPALGSPDAEAFERSRKPLVGEFTHLVSGRRLVVVANHFNSKGGDDPLFGRFQPGARPSEVRRHQQARLVNAFAAELLAADPGVALVVAGDFNDFEYSETLAILAGSVLHNLEALLPANERYDYVFEGNTQTLDHLLVSANLLAAGAEFDSVHINAEFADQISDHDGLVARLQLNRAPVVDAGGDVTIATGALFQRSAAFSDADAGDAWTGSVDWGDGSPTETLALRADQTFDLAHVFAFQGVFTVTVTITDARGGSGFDTVSVRTTGGLVAPWVRTDFGRPRTPGGAESIGEIFRLRGSGTVLGGRNDRGTFVHRDLPDHHALHARLLSIAPHMPFAYAGLALRSGDADDDAGVSLTLGGLGMLRLVARAEAGRPERVIALRFVGAPPLHLALARHGDRVLPAFSADGVVWNALPAVQVDLGGAPRVGMLVGGLAWFGQTQADVDAVELVPVVSD